jgi:hypothetical protein
MIVFLIPKSYKNGTDSAVLQGFHVGVKSFYRENKFGKINYQVVYKKYDKYQKNEKIGL